MRHPSPATPLRSAERLLTFPPLRRWDPLVSEFVERLDEVNEHLAKHGLPPISKGNATAGNQGLARRTVEGESAMEGSSH